MQIGTDKKGKREQKSPAYAKTVWRLIAVALVALIIVLNLFSHVFSVVRYYGDSMFPSLQNRQVLIIQKTGEIEEGDIIACYLNNKLIVRRVICTGGKTISINDSGIVTVNGVELPEPYVEQPSLGQSNITFPYNVSIGQYFIMGDNRAVSMDSRLSEIGTISDDRIFGKVIFALG